MDQTGVLFFGTPGTINDFAKTSKMAESKIPDSYLNPKEIAPKELKAKGLTNKSTKF